MLLPHFSALGSGPMVLMLHGAAGGYRSFAPQVERYAWAGYRAVAWDMPGYGASEPLEGFSLVAAADAAADLVGRLGGPAHVVGMSMGGMIALELALRHPTAVRSLALVSTSPAFGLDGTDPDAWRAQRLGPRDAGARVEEFAEPVLRALMAPDVDDAAVDVAVAAEPGAEAAVSWCADAGGGFGAIDAQVAHPTLAAADYAYGDTLAVLRNVPVAAVSTRLFEAGWSRAAADVVASDLVRDGQGTLRGSFAHHLPFPLTDCRVAHGGWIYDVGDLAPGERHDLAGGRGPRSLSGALARREAVKERQAAARWDRSGTDLARILEIAGFHAAAGGAGYTGLESGRLGRLDLSPLLPLDRAVLVGTAADPPPGWSTAWRVTDDAPGAVPQAPAPATRLYRIVIPLGAPSPPQSRAAERPVE